MDNFLLDSPVNRLPQICEVWIYSEIALSPSIAPVFEQHLKSESILGQMHQAIGVPSSCYYFARMLAQGPSNVRQTGNRFVTLYEFDISPQQLEKTPLSEPVWGLWALITTEGVFFIQAQ